MNAHLGTGAPCRAAEECRMTRELPALPPEDPNRKANPKAKAHPWRAWMPGALRDKGRREKGNG